MNIFKKMETMLNKKFEAGDKIRKPIFIVGCGRAGTTLLFDIVSQHPGLARTDGYPDGEDHEGWIEHGKCIMAEINAVSRVMRSGWVGMGQGDSTGEESAFRSVDLEGRSV